MVDEVGLKVNRAFSARALWISHFLGRCPRGLKQRHWRSAETGLKAGVIEMMKAIRNGFFTAECAIHRLKAGVSETGPTHHVSRALSHCRAKRATSREFFRSSLSLMWARWVSTVLGLRCSSFAI